MLPISFWLQPKKLRIFFAWVGIFLLFLYCRPSDRLFRLGVPVVIFGEFVRVWASGFLEKKGRILAVDGPFAYVRNPLYLGNFFIGLGVTIISGRILIALIFVLGFILIYRRTVIAEEKILTAEFGDEYKKYSEAVPRFIPKIVPFRHTQREHFRWERLIRHREYLTFIGLICIIGGLYFWEERVLENEFSWKEVATVILMVAMGIAAASLQLLSSKIKIKNSKA